MAWLLLIGLCVASAGPSAFEGPLPDNIIIPSPCYCAPGVSLNAEPNDDDDDRGSARLMALPQHDGQFSPASVSTPRLQHLTQIERVLSARAPPRA